MTPGTLVLRVDMTYRNPSGQPLADAARTCAFCARSVFYGAARLTGLAVAPQTIRTEAPRGDDLRISSSGAVQRGEREMAYVMVDVEADGPIPGDYSMIAFGAVLVQERIEQTFYGRLKPISEQWIPEALAVSGFSRVETIAFNDPKTVMEAFATWLKQHIKGRPFFVSDNNGFDFAFVSWYFWHFTGANPFGHSSTNLGSLYKGLVKDTFQNFKHLRRTAHTHHPVDDARGNAEALLEMKAMGLKIAL